MLEELKTEFVRHSAGLSLDGLIRQFESVSRCIVLDENRDNLPYYAEQVAVICALGAYLHGPGFETAAFEVAKQFGRN